MGNQLLKSWDGKRGETSSGRNTNMGLWPRRIMWRGIKIAEGWKEVDDVMCMCSGESVFFYILHLMWM